MEGLQFLGIFQIAFGVLFILLNKRLAKFLIPWFQIRNPGTKNYDETNNGKIAFIIFGVFLLLIGVTLLFFPDVAKSFIN
jgi:hypothetical protein